MNPQGRSRQRRERIDIITEWSQSGILEERRRLLVEEQFAERVARANSRFFIPLPLTYSDDIWYNTQVSFLLEAFDALPRRPDIAFDSVWKVLERSASMWLPSHLGRRRNITDTLGQLSADSRLSCSVTEILLADIPSQTCGYLFKRLITREPVESSGRARMRLAKSYGVGDVLPSEIEAFLALVEKRYAAPDTDTARRGAMLLRRALNGETLDVAETQISLSLHARMRILLCGLLYTVRNERYHGESFSPFYSSAASIKTYTHPHYLFLAAYALVHLVWAHTNNSYAPSLDAVEENTVTNLREARALYARHWSS
ncbi:hypothetical protein [Streptomyces fulvorobeus]|uniref:Uncharacterized protein n=1 Tax=Streptomyces fulvorobeus TaxID=284028 RepID=A0A7J0C882_9ACTN|nr:hypothetical protein [Streptomyces fulvorobeus]NYE41581.1 hypothetical protein [Streptomyces fulvorobeus]GFM97946.1 hypothetical protein Sfulv_27570 [Streptomyces fulvorobeus]